MRDYKFDNLKALLIFLVVFGHFLTGMQAMLPRWLYLNIYLFHMPLFIYISGRFAKTGKGIIRKFLCPYLIWQTVYLWFVNLIPGSEQPMTLLTPYHHLWFLAVQIYYQGTVQLGVKPTKIAVLIAFIAALFVGYIPCIGNRLALSRAICFYPFFLLGRRQSLEQNPTGIKKVFSIGCMVCAAFWFWLFYRIPIGQIHYNTPYTVNGSSLWFRAGTMAAGIAWSYILIQTISMRNVRWITKIGQYTFPIFILHAFCTILANALGIFRNGSWTHLISAAGLAVYFCILFGRKSLQKLTQIRLPWSCQQKEKT